MELTSIISFSILWTTSFHFVSGQSPQNSTNSTAEPPPHQHAPGFAPVEDVVFGKFEMTSDLNYQDYVDYMKAIGYRGMYIGIAKTLRMQIEILKRYDGWYEYRRGYKLLIIESKFQDGVEFDDRLPDGKPCKMKISFHGNKMIQYIQTVPKKGPPSAGTVTFEMFPDKMISTWFSKGVKAVMEYRRIYN